MKQPKLYRQGDVLFRRIDKAPVGDRAVRLNGVVALGEATGHTHAISDLEAAEVYEIESGVFLEVNDGGVSIIHQEHSPIALPKGDYAVTIQREYSPSEIRNVAD